MRRPPADEAMHPPPRPPLLERGRELELAKRTLARVGAGAGAHAIVVTGAPGSGRSALLAAVVRSAEQAGFAAIAADRPAPPSLERARGAVLAIDDADQLPSAAHATLRRLLRELRSAPLLVAIATERTPLSRPAAWLAQLETTVPTIELAPAPLSGDAVRALACAALGDAAGGDVAAVVARRTAGVPALVAIVLDAVLAGGAAGSACPAAAVRFVDRLLARLGPREQRLVAATAVLADIARERPDLVVELADLETLELAGACERAAAVGLFASVARPDFAAPLLADAVERRLTPAARGQLHARAARMLAGEGAAPAAVARHVLAAPPRAFDGALAVLADAAREALEQGAPAHALALVERALAERPDPRTRGELLLLLGQAQLGCGRSQAVATLDAAARQADASTAVVAARAAARARAMAGTPDPAAALRDALARHRRLPPEEALVARAELAALERAFVSSASAGSALARELRAAIEGAADTRRERPQAHPSSPAVRGALAVVACDAALAGEPAATVAALARAALDAPVRELLDELSLGYLALTALIFCDRLDEADAALWAMVGEAERRSQGLAHVLATGLRAVVALRRGRVALARDLAKSAIERATADGWGARQWVPVEVLASALIESGEFDAAARLVAERRAHSDPDEGWAPAATAIVEGRLELERDRPERALELLDSAGAHALRWRAPSPGALAWRPLAASAAAACGQLDRARGLLADELALADRAELERPRAAALRVLAVTGVGPPARRSPHRTGRDRPSRAVTSRERIAWLEEAAGLAGRIEAEIDLAYVEADLGALLRRLGRRRDARAVLARAVERALACGSQLAAERAARELAAAGGRPLPPAGRGATALTASELRVARLAAAGRSNREIADALFITTKTVEYHLSRAYRKLGIASRRDLAAALRDAQP